MVEIRVLVTGGRDYADRATVRRTLRYLAEAYIHGFAPGEVVLVHGDAPGADTLAAEEATALGWRTEAHPADWSAGRSAGPARNLAMVRKGAHYCLAFPGGQGTANCRRLAQQAGIPVIDIKEETRRG